MTLPVLDSMQALSTHVEAAMTAESRRIHDSIGHVQGNLASNPATVNDLQQPLEVELMCAPACVDTAEAADSKGASVTGRVVLEGVLHGRAMVNKKDSVAAAVEMLKVWCLYGICRCPRNWPVMLSMLPCVQGLTQTVSLLLSPIGSAYHCSTSEPSLLLCKVMHVNLIATDSCPSTVCS